jgi:hypothetical protein
MNNTKEYPQEVIEKMLEHQESQSGKKNINVFDRCMYEGRACNGFDWARTPEGYMFWARTILERKYDHFFKKYPSKNKGGEPGLFFVKDTKELPLPRVVLVSHDNENWCTRVLFMIKNNPGVVKPFICWGDVKTIEESKTVVDTYPWRFMKEIPQPVKLSKQQIAEKFGIEIDQLNITD